jgi:hypothetical protein
MWGLRSFTAVGGFVALLVAITAGVSPAKSGRNDSPESKLRSKIADLHAEVALLDVECAACRHNLLASLKKLGQLELGDRKAAISRIGDELREARRAGVLMGASLRESGEVLKKMERNVEKTGSQEEREQFKLFATMIKGGDEGEKAMTRIAEQEFQARLDSARSEAERLKADFLTKCRLLHQKKLELADAEAEYKATK